MTKRRLTLATVATLCFATSSAHAFFEEGNDHANRLGYMKCNRTGDLIAAQTTGCNPWPDNDSSYSYKASKDMKKSSFHFNLTASLAVAAGFNRCAAYAIALWNEATDVGSDYDREFWAPFPKGVLETAGCATLLADNNIAIVTSTVTGEKGGWVSPDFTDRAFGARQDNEVNRESNTFHFNHNDIHEQFPLQCDVADSAGQDGVDPLPVQPPIAGADGPFRNMVPLSVLYDWATSDQDPALWFNPLNECAYAQADGSSLYGPLTHYDPIHDDDPTPGSLGALGTFLHSSQDFWSHRLCEDVTHDFGGGTDTPCGFVSSHFAGDYGTINGVPANGKTTIKTNLSHKILRHSGDTVEAAKETYQLLKEYLALNPQYARAGAKNCDTVIHDFTTRWASIANLVPAKGKPSGAKQRADLADALFASDTCSYPK